ncbi:Bacillosamine/Legionaminic acid biosynthesis aminotransferase PglE; 4-keto-6-deoxy-N-Acetyl-D-hexosaminyl-(Lipid carrier) aminotransferase [Olavius sp. associated proteobacterium Delta 1]|nr:Bacillosamine/Legionaminic acid biosynthesis aminotransferase PglE; 4-keto-6-deoxy-N-Acetyl-D-hexosaminyl-(Lipid carrier) aminotransferase [Olavius sp. associated proteobacterium Delta 1]
MNNQEKIVGKETIPHSRPTLGPQEAKAVSAVIESGYIAEGEIVNTFESAFAKFLGVEYATSTNSGTSALHLTLLAMGVGQGDEVIIPSYVCSALLNAVNYTGATPILADINPDTYNLNAADVQRFIKKSTKAIIVPHLFGLAADMEPLLELEVPIVEDCAQSIGATHHQRPVGLFGVAGIFSFYATKVITTGEGGMVTTNSSDIAARIRDLKAYDKREDYKIRFNYKMTDIQAALGIVQLKQLRSFIRRRKKIAEGYNRAFYDLRLKLPPTDTGQIYFRYVLDLKMDSRPWIQELARMGITCDRPIHFPLHQNLKLGGYPATEKAWKQSLSIPIYPTLTDEEISRVIESVTRCCEKFANFI